MRYAAVLITLILAGILLTSCALIPEVGGIVAAEGTERKVSAVNLDRLQTLCRWVDPLAHAASHMPSIETRTVGQFAVAYCATLLAGTVPVTTDVHTEQWLMDMHRSLSAAVGA